MHMDAINLQLGAVTSQNGKPIDFLQQKTKPSTNVLYNNRKDLLAIVEMIKNSKTFLLGKN